jgi:hypothetical protein
MVNDDDDEMVAGLPDFSWCNRPKRGKIYQNIHTYVKWPKISQPLPVQGPPKFTQIGIFGFETMPSGNPEWLLGIDVMWLRLINARQSLSGQLFLLTGTQMLVRKTHSTFSLMGVDPGGWGALSVSMTAVKNLGFFKLNN